MIKKSKIKELKQQGKCWHEVCSMCNDYVTYYCEQCKEFIDSESWEIKEKFKGNVLSTAHYPKG